MNNVGTIQSSPYPDLTIGQSIIQRGEEKKEEKSLTVVVQSLRVENERTVETDPCMEFRKFTKLPSDLNLEIATFLDIPSYINLLQASKQLQQFLKSKHSLAALCSNQKSHPSTIKFREATPYRRATYPRYTKIHTAISSIPFYGWFWAPDLDNCCSPYPNPLLNSPWKWNLSPIIASRKRPFIQREEFHQKIFGAESLIKFNRKRSKNYSH